MTNAKTRPLVAFVALDAALLAAACLIPAASHVLAFPLYFLYELSILLCSKSPEKSEANG